MQYNLGKQDEKQGFANPDIIPKTYSISIINDKRKVGVKQAK